MRRRTLSLLAALLTLGAVMFAGPPAQASTSSHTFSWNDGTLAWVDVTLTYSGGYVAVTDEVVRGDSGGSVVQIIQHVIGGSHMAGGTVDGYGYRVGSGSRWERAGRVYVLRLLDQDEDRYQTFALGT